MGSFCCFYFVLDKFLHEPEVPKEVFALDDACTVDNPHQNVSWLCVN